MIDALTLEGFLRAPWLFILAAAVAVAGVGRVIRLVTYDDFPPSEWFRSTWVKITKGSKWGKIAYCLWCFSPYITAFAIAWLIVGLLWVPWLTGAWWVVFGWMAVSYLASLLAYWDEGGSADGS